MQNLLFFFNTLNKLFVLPDYLVGPEALQHPVLAVRRTGKDSYWKHLGIVNSRLYKIKFIILYIVTLLIEVLRAGSRGSACRGQTLNGGRIRAAGSRSRALEFLASILVESCYPCSKSILLEKLK